MRQSVTIDAPRAHKDYYQDVSVAFTPTPNPSKFRMWEGGQNDDRGTIPSQGSARSPFSQALWSTPTPPTVPNRRPHNFSGESGQAATPSSAPSLCWPSSPASRPNCALEAALSATAASPSQARGQKAALLEACPLKEGCFCAKGDLVRHLIHDHKMKTTPLDSDGGFRTVMMLSLSTTGRRNGVVLELEDGQHLLWLFERSGGSESGTMDIGVAVYTLPDYRGPRLSVRIACSKTEDCVEKMVWTGQLQRLRENVRPSTMRLRYPESDCFERVAEDKMSVIIDTTLQ